MKTTLIKKLRARHLAKFLELGALASNGDRSVHRPHAAAKAKTLSHEHAAQGRIKAMKAQENGRSLG